MLYDIFKYEFLTNALIASLLSSVICGIIGVIITEKKLTMMCGGIAHTAYGGVGLGYLLGFEPIIGAAAFSVSSAIAIGTIRRKTRANTDIIISLFWSLGMALGVIFISLMEGYPPDMNSYLFGNILSVTKLDIYLMLILVSIIFLFTVAFFNDLKAYMLDGEFAKVIGIKTTFYEYAILILTALSIVVVIRAVGIILCIALFSAPSATASLMTKSLKLRMLLSSLLSAIFCSGGLLVSYNFTVSSGAVIVFIATAVYFISLIIKKIFSKN